MPRIVVFILVAVFLQALLWVTLIPLWHFPDEQAHFSQVQNYAETGGSPVSHLDLSKEIYESEQILGTLRDERGNNRYTYNPGYNLTYQAGPDGEAELYIKNVPRSYRTIYMKAESPRYPPLYYLYSAIPYRLFYGSDIFSRVFAVRIASVLLHLGLVVFTYRLAHLLFPHSPYLTLGSTLAVAFQPMLMYVSSGINNDTLINLLSVMILFYALKHLHHPLTYRNTGPLLLLIIAGIFTKQLIYFLLPGVAFILLYRLVKFKYISNKLVLFVIPLSLITVLLFTFFNDGFWEPYWPNSPSFNFQQVGPLLTAKMSQLYRETLPWYWGVYKWLGVVLPLWLLRFIKLTMVIACLGWAKYVVQTPRQRTLALPVKKSALLFMIAFMYVLLLVIWDSALTLKMGFGHGIQGRYFFPTLCIHMVLLTGGLGVWLSQLSHKLIPLTLYCLMLTLNYYSLYHVSSVYYDHTSAPTFHNQMSQYKPDWAKWPAFGIMLIASFFAHGVVVSQLVSLPNTSTMSSTGQRIQSS